MAFLCADVHLAGGPFSRTVTTAACLKPHEPGVDMYKVENPPDYLNCLFSTASPSFVGHTLAFVAMTPAAWIQAIVVLALALPIVRGQRNTCAAGAEGSQGARCLKNQQKTYASAYCSSFLAITTPTTVITSTITEYAE